MVRIARQAGRPFLLVVLWSAWLLAHAQTPPPSQDTQPITYKVIHDHAIGQGQGELRIIERGIAFKGEGKDEDRHSRTWRDEDIKRLAISRDNLRVTVYEAAHISLLPRKAPFTDGKSIRNGAEHNYLFRLREGEITPTVVAALLARFPRSIETSVLPDNTASDPLLFAIPVFHRHRAGGHSGELRVYEHHVVFAAEDTSDMRFWRYTDIRDIGQLGRYQFELATYEGQFGVDGKSYLFDLKRPLTEAEYERLWTKVYEQGRRTGVRLTPKQPPQ
jgi:hypothetical protein